MGGGVLCVETESGLWGGKGGISHASKGIVSKEA